MLKKITIISIISLFLIINSCKVTEPVGGNVSIDIPLAVEDFIWGDEVEIKANSTNIDKVTKIKFYIDDEMVLEDNLEPYVYNWDTSNIVYGEHTVKVTAYYNNDTEDSQTLTVYYSPCPILASDLANIANITETDAQGNLIEGGNIDPDDWYFTTRDSLISFGPAYPNPTTQSCFIPFEFDSQYTATMIIINRDYEIIATLFDDDNPDEDYVNWNAPENVNDIYRCIFHVSDSLHWHGDIIVE